MRDPTHLYEGEPSPGAKRFAQIVSFFAQAPFISVPVFILLCMEADTTSDVVLFSFISILFATIVPMIGVIVISKRTGNEDGDIVRKEDRMVPLAIGIASYLFGTSALLILDSPRIVWVAMLCYCVNTAVIMVITTKWKISIHAIGCVGPAMALAYVYGWQGGLLIILLPIVVWCRYILRKHTPAQLAAGALLGFVLTGILFIALL